MQTSSQVQHTKFTDQRVKVVKQNGNHCHGVYELSDMKTSQNPIVLENECADDDADDPN